MVAVFLPASIVGAAKDSDGEKERRIGAFVGLTVTDEKKPL